MAARCSACTDEKKIPASAVRERVEAIRKQKEADGAEFNKTDERIAKEEITEGFLPHMPAATSLTYAYIDRELGMLFVGASEAGADDFVAAMKGALAGTRSSCWASRTTLRQVHGLGEGIPRC